MIGIIILQAVLRATSAEMDGLVQKVGQHVNMPVRIAKCLVVNYVPSSSGLPNLN